MNRSPMLALALLALLSQGASSQAGLPLAFEHDQPGRFSARGPGYGVFLTPGEVVIAMPSADEQGQPRFESLRMRFAGDVGEGQLRGVDRFPGVNNHYRGADTAAWRERVPLCSAVRCAGLYPGVEVVYYGTHGRLEYDFVVAAGADSGVIRLSFEGAGQIGLEDGKLRLTTPAGDIVQHAPAIYQERDGQRVEVEGGYVLGENDEVGFRVGEYDHGLPLVIDPVLSFASFVGGSSDEEFQGGVVVDDDGFVYLSGWATSFNFPTVNPAQATKQGIIDAVVVKLAPGGSSIIYSSFLGGSKPLGDPSAFRGREEGWGIAVDPAGNAYLAGDTSSPDLPVTAGAYDTTCGIDGNCGTGDGFYDAFVAKLAPDGTLIYSTYLGGSGHERPWGGIAADAAGSAYVAGWTSSTDFPTTAGAFETIFPGGTDTFVTKLSPDGSSLLYSTFLGGGTAAFGFPSDLPYAITVDGQGQVYVGGASASIDYPTTPGSFQPTVGPQSGTNGFVTKLSADGSSLVYSTYLGDGGTSVNGLAIDDLGRCWAGGTTGSSAFPTTAGAFQPSFAGGSSDLFAAQLSADGSTLLSATYLGSVGNDDGTDLALGPAGTVNLTGNTTSTLFPLAAPLFSSFTSTTTAIVARLSPDASSLLFSTFLGFSSYGGMDVDPAGTIWVAGSGSLGAFSLPVAPQVNPLQGFGGSVTDAYVAAISGLDPWVDLCGSLAGAHGEPVLSGSGTLLSGDLVTLTLGGALQNAPTTLVVGASNLSASFKGGTLVPTPTVLIGGLTTGPAGDLVLASTWPGGVPPGTTLYYQYWIVDSMGANGLSASNGLAGTSP